jgi:hypothetical protein
VGVTINCILLYKCYSRRDDCNFGGSFEIICNFGGFVVFLVGPEKNVVFIVGPL